MMKRLCPALLALFLALLAALCLTACGGGQLPEAGGKNASAAAADAAGGYVGVKVDIDITEPTFKGWINELYTSPSDYLGKTVRLEGVLCTFQTDDGNTYHTVYRDGCCAGDHMYALEFIPSGSLTAENGDWIEVIGTFGGYFEGNDEYYTLKGAAVTVKTQRGSEQLGL